MVFWPSGVGMAQVLGSKVGGNYSADSSSTAVKTGYSMDYADDWGSIVFLNETSDGFEYYDSISVSTHNTLPFEINASVLVMDMWGDVLS